MERRKARWRRAAEIRSMETRILTSSSPLMVPSWWRWLSERLLGADESEEAWLIFRPDIFLGVFVNICSTIVDAS